ALSFLVLHLPPSSVIYTLSLHDALPILAPLVSLNSKVKSKAEKTSLLIISPPLVVCPSRALAIFNAPCSTIHPDFGKESLVTPCHSDVLRPSNNSLYPWSICPGDNSLGVRFSMCISGGNSEGERFSVFIRMFLKNTFFPSNSGSLMLCT